MLVVGVQVFGCSGVRVFGAPSLRAVGMALFITLCLPRTALAQDVATIIKKTNAVYANAKTYQVTYRLDSSMGAIGTVSQIIDVKMIPYHKTWITTRAIDKGTSQATMPMPANTQSVDDGNTMVTYIQSTHKYIKRPHTAGTSFNGLKLLARQLTVPMPNTANDKLLPPTIVNGKAAYIIEIDNIVGQRLETVHIFIDKATYHVLQVRYDIHPSNASGTTAPTGAMTTLMTVKTEKFNQPIPSSLFKFNPPPGATDMQRPSTMMGSALPKGK
jgi:outer membrane lipoprotein-sorting protein